MRSLRARGGGGGMHQGCKARQQLKMLFVLIIKIMNLSQNWQADPRPWFCGFKYCC
jgi:hypothetical protein